ncbi:MAG: sigma-54 dependent transcriptional regulator [Balneolaceae bacterium]
MSKKHILVIDDDAHILDFMKELLTTQSYNVQAFGSANTALKEVSENPPDLVITDVKMDEMTGDEILSHIKKEHPQIGVIVITGFGNIAHSVHSMQKGAFDYITKPFTAKEFLRRIEQFFWHKENHIQVSRPQESGNGKNGEPEQKKMEVKSAFTDISRAEMVGNTSQVQHLKDILKQIAPTSAPILIQGESGTGKEVYANLIQQHRQKRNEPYVKINCANLPSELVESTLFGHVKGSFTGAINDQEGAFKKADGGTLLLDEITETNINVQAKLLRVLQEKEFRKIGSQEPQKVDVRIIATTNRDPSEAIKEGIFRKDLYFRLNVFPIRIPPLRERTDDIPLLAKHFCDTYSAEYNLPEKKISKKLESHLLTRNWTGNIRELENYIIRGVIMAQNADSLEIEHCENELFDTMNEDLSENFNNDLKVMPIEEMEIIMVKKALEQTNGNQKEAARLLNVSDRTIRNKLKKINFPGGNPE